MRDTERGFTLIEVLVVIGIIALIAGIVFPCFAAAKAKSRQAQCLSNLRQLGSAMMMYASDWDDTLPTARVVEGVDGNAAGNWAGVYHVGGKCDPSVGQIYGYVRNTAIYLCPSARGVTPSQMKAADALPYPLSYSMNNWLSRKPLGSITGDTSKIGLLAHESAQTIDDGDLFWAGWEYETDGYNMPTDVHSGGACAVYCDLHAKWQSFEAMVHAIAYDEWNPFPK